MTLTNLPDPARASGGLGGTRLGGDEALTRVDQINHCVLWLDASNRSRLSFDEDGGVMMVADRSVGHKPFHFVQPDAKRRPRWMERAHGNLGGLVVNGNGEFMFCTRTCVPGSTRRTIYAVARLPWGASAAMFSLGGGETGGEYIILPSYAVRSGSSIREWSIPDDPHRMRLLEIVLDGSLMQDHRLYDEDGEIAEVFGYNMPMQQIETDGPMSWPSMPGRPEATGVYGEILVFTRALRAAERDVVRHYLTKKWILPQ